MEKAGYRLERSGEFVIENYNSAKAFSSFFPGIAGLYGVPMWVFYVNRGQCIASFGTRDKGGAILEFYPANQAYNLTSLKGFRTFIRTGSLERVYEPFRGPACSYSAKTQSRMIFDASRLKLEEDNADIGLKTEVTYTTVPEEPFAALARLTVLTNTSDRHIQGEIIDGLPHIIPYGMNEWLQKHMSRTIEAWMQVTNVEKKIPFYALKARPEDRPELEHIDRGNFYLAVAVTEGSPRFVDVIVDPDAVFGRDGDISFPAVFANSGGFLFPKSQRTEGKTPSAFAYSRFSLRPGESMKIVSLAGNTDTPEKINSRKDEIIGEGFFNAKLKKNEEIIGRIENTAFTKSSSNEFDCYARQTFLDNLLRGGFPHSIETPRGPFVFYLYGRKHGDLERDYNNFNLLPSYFSQGNGAYRDMNQNRRNDVFFNTDVAEDNIATFVNALQPDGFNPLHIHGVVLSVAKGRTLDIILRKHITKKSDRKKVADFIKEGFTPGEILFYLEKHGIAVQQDTDLFLKDLLGISSKENILHPGEGYWIDHWTYNLDLVENYLAVYPERLKELLIGKKIFTFYDTWKRVAPRAEKYKLSKGRIRQYGAVIEDDEKKRMIESRQRARHSVRTSCGKGRVYCTSLFAKLMTLIANKIASLDPFGIGIEMEANKPGWCDSLNNLPAIFGSSLSETAELKRLVVFLKNAGAKAGFSGDTRLRMPEETADFIRGLSRLLRDAAKKGLRNGDFLYWDRSASLKEGYRRRVWIGYSGREKPVTAEETALFLELCLSKLDKALAKSLDKRSGIPYTYFYHEVTKYRMSGKNKSRPAVKALSFSNTPVPYFLEGPMHMMKVLDDRDRKKKLYDAVRASALFDGTLKMYKINVPLAGMPSELGRSTVFTPGWLENESVFLHMEYKYMLEVLRGGLYDEFFQDIKTALVCFMRPDIYGRSILENSSFIASGAHPDPSIHGTGFVARLSGSTTEFMSLWLSMCVGKAPFGVDERGSLTLTFDPILPGWLFTEKESREEFYFDDKEALNVVIPRDSFAFAFLGRILVIYRNPQRKNTYGQDCVRPKKIILKKGIKDVIEIDGGVVPSPYALAVRNGDFRQIEMHLA